MKVDYIERRKLKPDIASQLASVITEYVLPPGPILSVPREIRLDPSAAHAAHSALPHVRSAVKRDNSLSRFADDSYKKVGVLTDLAKAIM